MVNKGSFFQRLKERWGSSSRVRVDRRSGGAAAAAADIERLEPVPTRKERELSAGGPVERKSSRKMSEREEAMLALNSQFQELTTLLRGSHQKVDDKLGKLVSSTDALRSLPAVGEKQLETLRQISTHMEQQSKLGEQMATTVNRLPTMLENVEKALVRAAATDERTAATVKEFHSTMDRIHTSMSKQVEATQKLAEGRDDTLREVAKGIETSQADAMDRLQQTTDDSLKSLRRTHEDQSNRLQKVVEVQAGWNRAVLIGVGLVVIGIGALIALQLVQ